MRISKLPYYFLLMHVLSLLACSTARQVSAQQQGPFVPWNDTHIQYEGRVGMMADAAELYWSGTTATIRFTGTGAGVTLQDFNGQSYFNIIVDNTVTGRIRIDSVKKQYVLAENLPPGRHTITLFKRTQIHKEYKRGYIRLYGFTLAPGSKIDRPARLPSRKMEFYGNSITCGHAIEDTTGGDSGASQYENNYLAYGAVTARHYNARYRCIAKSGIGLMVSFGALIMPEMYDRLNPFDSTSMWNFASYTPDIVVVNLLQNDAGIFTRPEYEHFKKRFGATAPPGDSVVQAYRRFIRQLRGHYPQAHIICVLGSMNTTAEGAPWPGYVREAVEGLHDPKLYTHFFTYMGRPAHPRVKDQAVMAESLIRFIDKTIQW